MSTCRQESRLYTLAVQLENDAAHWLAVRERWRAGARRALIALSVAPGALRDASIVGADHA